MARKHITDIQVVKNQLDWIDMNRDGCPIKMLSKKTGECQKVVYRAMERAYEKDYLECGVSLRCGWVTDKGKELIKNGT